MPTLTEKIIKAHLQEGTMDRGCPIAIKIDQTLTQDATGTMAYLQLEAMGVDQVKTELSVSYVDHNTLQSGFENADDHKYLQTVANKHGIYFSRPGNGICHQVHLERFAAPGKTLLEVILILLQLVVLVHWLLVLVDLMLLVLWQDVHLI